MVNLPSLSPSGSGLVSEQWWPRISGKMRQVHLSRVRWSSTIWPCFTSILVVRESNTSPWISLFFLSLFAPFSFSAPSAVSDPSSSLVNSVSRVCPWPWHYPLPSVSEPLLHTTTHTLQPIDTHTKNKTPRLTHMCTCIHVSHTFIYVHACTPLFRLSFVWRAQQWPLWISCGSLLICLSSCLPLLPLFSFCAVLPSLYIYLTSSCFLWKQQTWQVRFSWTLLQGKWK